MDTPERLLVGRIQRPHGLTGEVSVEVLTSFPERFRSGLVLSWTRDGAADRRLTLEAVRPHGARMLMTFEGVGDLAAARALSGGELGVEAGEAFPAPEGFYYAHDLSGFACEDAEGNALGSAAGVEETPAGPMLTLVLASGKEALVPFVAEFVRKIDRDGRTMVLDLPAGLLDL